VEKIGRPGTGLQADRSSCRGGLETITIVSVHKERRGGEVARASCPLWHGRPARAPS